MTLSERLTPVAQRLSRLRGSIRRLYALDGLSRLVLAFFAFVLVLAYRAYQEIGVDDTSGMRISEPGDDALPPMGY